MNEFPVFAVLLGALLSGCIGGTGGDVVTNEPPQTPVGSTTVARTTAGTTATATGSIVGTVTDEELRPIADATVSLTELQVRIVTGSDGAFEFLSVPEGRHVVEAQAPGHVGQSLRLEVSSGDRVQASFLLSKLEVHEPRVEVVQHSVLIKYNAGPTSYLTSVGQCEPACWWYTQPLEDPDHVIVEIFGEHSVPHPRGWDGLLTQVRAYPADNTTFQIVRICPGGPTGDMNHPCVRLPIRYDFNATEIDEGWPRIGSIDRLGILFQCEQSWFCLDDGYEGWLSLFYDWEGREIPSEYSANPDGS